ncbi:uncharacterized protein [Amphiura filiformis]|uniref:uncharacterized protein n=1 Tax=Amphiura filiformis TaxID=82378 RepID=UPI003B228B7B
MSVIGEKYRANDRSLGDTIRQMNLIRIASLHKDLTTAIFKVGLEHSMGISNDAKFLAQLLQQNTVIQIHRIKSSSQVKQHHKDSPVVIIGSENGIMNGQECCLGAVMRLSNDPACPVIKFADDSAMIGLIADDDDTVYQQQLVRFVNYCDANYLELNVSKTKEMVVDFRTSKSRSPGPVVLKGGNVERVSSYKYLGIMIDDKLNWHIHVDHMVKKLNSRMYCFRKLNFFHVNSRILALFYDSVVASVWRYCLLCWGGNITIGDRQRVERNIFETNPNKDTGATSGEAKPEEDVATTGDETLNKAETLNLEFMKLDLSSLSSTMGFINAYKVKGYPLHTLVCNAGIGTPKQEYTSDDFEIHFQVNYLGHYLMILHLLPLIKQSGPNSRIVFTTSGAFSFKTSTAFNIDDMQGKISSNSWKMQGNSKLFQVMSMYAFERRTKRSQVGWFAVNPGVVNTDIFRNYNSAFNFMSKSLETVGIAKSAKQGAEVLLRAILDPAYDGREALYFDHKCATNSHNPGTLARNVEKQEALWKYSLECLKDYINDDIMADLQLPT